jgi:hypothetical protein
MPRKKSNPFLFQNLTGKSISFSLKEKSVIDGLKPLVGGEWNGKIKSGCFVRRIDRNAVVTSIKHKLIKIQDKYCIYCGLHENHCGRLEREHIAPKGTTSHPEFMFEPQNLALACHHCNVDLKGEYDTISKKVKTYSKCKFNIVHPYFDPINKHIVFAVKNGMALIKTAPRSRKGKNHIQLFQLDSVPKTEKRTGLLLVDSLKIGNKYDRMLDSALNKKFVRK